MSMATAFTIIAALVPYIPEAETVITEFITRLKGGETLDALIAEFEAKANDLPDLTFGQ